MVTKPRYSSVYPWPLNHLQTRTKRSAIIKHLKAVKYYNKTIEEVYQEVEQCCRSLSDRLDDKEYFFGTNPTEADALLFGHLYCIINHCNIDRFVRIIEKFPCLQAFTENIWQKYFTPVYDFSSVVLNIHGVPILITSQVKVPPYVPCVDSPSENSVISIVNSNQTLKVTNKLLREIGSLGPQSVYGVARVKNDCLQLSMLVDLKKSADNPPTSDIKSYLAREDSDQSVYGEVNVSKSIMQMTISLCKKSIDSLTSRLSLSVPIEVPKESQVWDFNDTDNVSQNNYWSPNQLSEIEIESYIISDNIRLNDSQLNKKLSKTEVIIAESATKQIKNDLENKTYENGVHHHFISEVREVREHYHKHIPLTSMEKNLFDKSITNAKTRIVNNVGLNDWDIEGTIESKLSQAHALNSILMKNNTLVRKCLNAILNRTNSTSHNSLSSNEFHLSAGGKFPPNKLYPEDDGPGRSKSPTPDELDAQNTSDRSSATKDTIKKVVLIPNDSEKSSSSPEDENDSEATSTSHTQDESEVFKDASIDSMNKTPGIKDDKIQHLTPPNLLAWSDHNREEDTHWWVTNEDLSLLSDSLKDLYLSEDVDSETDENVENDENVVNDENDETSENDENEENNEIVKSTMNSDISNPRSILKISKSGESPRHAAKKTSFKSSRKSTHLPKNEESSDEIYSHAQNNPAEVTKRSISKEKLEELVKILINSEIEDGSNSTYSIGEFIHSTSESDGTSQSEDVLTISESLIETQKRITEDLNLLTKYFNDKDKDVDVGINPNILNNLKSLTDFWNAFKSNEDKQNNDMETQTITTENEPPTEDPEKTQVKEKVLLILELLKNLTAEARDCGSDEPQQQKNPQTTNMEESETH